MAREIYDQNLDFAWIEAVNSEASEGEHEPLPRWHPPKFTCDRHMPSRRRAWITGMGGAIDFFGTSRLWDGTGLYRSYALSPSHANALAIYSDWCSVGGDLHYAVEGFERAALEKVNLQSSSNTISSSVEE
jgi:hypothetical protein